jgi:hypothetical protein
MNISDKKFFILIFQNSELCLPVWRRGGAKTQSITKNMHTKEVFDKATFNKAR